MKKVEVLKKRRVRNTNNPRPPQKEEESTIPSITVPNMTLSLEELVNRQRLGQNVAVFDASFQQNDEYDGLTAGIEKMDEMERRDFLKTLRSQNQIEAMELHQEQVRKQKQKEEEEAEKLKAAQAQAASEQSVPPLPNSEAKP